MLKEYEEYWTGFRKGQHNYQQQEILSNDDINQMNKEACAQFGEAFQEYLLNSTFESYLSHELNSEFLINDLFTNKEILILRS
ncbi:2968_t:CDS:2, partial [Entrophospora sp. SA101]